MCVCVCVCVCVFLCVCVRACVRARLSVRVRARQITPLFNKAIDLTSAESNKRINAGKTVTRTQQQKRAAYGNSHLACERMQGASTSPKGTSSKPISVSSKLTSIRDLDLGRFCRSTVIQQQPLLTSTQSPLRHAFRRRDLHHALEPSKRSPLRHALHCRSSHDVTRHTVVIPITSCFTPTPYPLL